MPRPRKPQPTPQLSSVSLQFNTAGMTTEELYDYMLFAETLIRSREEATENTLIYLKTYVKPQDPELLRVFCVRASCDSDVLQIVLRKELLPRLRALHKTALERLDSAQKLNTKVGEHA
ncbi:hypothetical protein HMPREF9702_00334 [Delftia acidovorans CCUG 15835]|nr:hypothetical protein HMPREF9702_00334 [Delftia acidovorans CCUG 15835]